MVSWAIPVFELDDIVSVIAIVSFIGGIILYLINLTKKTAREVEEHLTEKQRILKEEHVRLIEKQEMIQHNLESIVNDNIELVKHIQNSLCSNMEYNTRIIADKIEQQKNIILEVKNNVGYLSEKFSTHNDIIAKNSVIIESVVKRLDHVEGASTAYYRNKYNIIADDEDVPIINKNQH